MQGYAVTVTRDPAEAALLSLADPPSAVVADLWMPSISGVQLCRLLRAEPATENVPVILRGPEQGRRHRFWADRAGASAYVGKGRMGDLARAISTAIAAAPDLPPFTTELHGAESEIRDRIAGHLDQALFESVLASEVRALSVAGRFDRLFDLFTQLVAQVTSYRWLAVSTASPHRLGVHMHPGRRSEAEREARDALGIHDSPELSVVEDEDAHEDAAGPAAIVAPIVFGEAVIGRVGLAPRAPLHTSDPKFVAVLARELAGPLRIAALVEESEKRATRDPLTGLLNRRALMGALEFEVSRARSSGRPFSAVLLDVDHFKQINDGYGHASGDLALEAVAELLRKETRRQDLLARWGGEEFVMILPALPRDEAVACAIRIRHALENIQVVALDGRAFNVTASFGVAEYRPEEDLDDLLDRADRAMYRAKADGRNRVVSEDRPSGESSEAPALRRIG